MQKAQASVKKSVKRDVKKAQAAVKQVQTSVKRDVKRVQVNVGKDVRKAQVAVRKVETQAKQAAVAVEKKIAAVSEPMIAAAVNITPSPLSRAFLATSAGKKEVAEHPEIIANLDDHGAPESQS